MTLQTIDAHAAGGPVRVIVSGLPSLAGSTLRDRAEWLIAHAGRSHRLLFNAPRGHADLLAAVLTPPIAGRAHAGVVLVDADGPVRLSVHALIALATVALERGLLVVERLDAPLTVECESGEMRVSVRVREGADGRRVESVTVEGLCAAVIQAGAMVRAEGRVVPVDIAVASGVCYAIADAEAAGLGLAAKFTPELRRTAAGIARAIAETRRLVNPFDQSPLDVAGVAFTAAPQDERADLRVVSVSARGRVDPSPGGTAMGAVLAVIDAMGIAPGDRPFVVEGLSRLTMEARIGPCQTNTDVPAISLAVTGSAWVVAEQTFVMQDDDPLSESPRPW